jgi:ketosteroid isomerase-like protein
LRRHRRKRTVARLSNSGEFLQEIDVNKRNLVWGWLVVVMMMNGAAAQAATAGTAEQAVTAAEHQWLKSQQMNNVDLLAPLLADKVVETTEEGKVLAGKDAVLTAAKSDKWSSADYTDLKVTVFGDTAIATGIFTGKGTDAAGKPVDARVRFTDTWVLANGKWMCVATQDSPLKL